MLDKSLGNRSRQGGLSSMQLAIVADDLSGAAECASHALLRVSRSSVVLNGSPDPADRIVTIDTDTRGRPVDGGIRPSAHHGRPGAFGPHRW